MKTFHVFWEVDGVSGHTQIKGESQTYVRHWFARYYGRFGYCIYRISNTY